jgi:hypothetical protein
MAWAGGHARTLYHEWKRRGVPGPGRLNPLTESDNERLGDPAQASDACDLVFEALCRMRGR